MNSKLEVKLRKHENTLTVSGFAVLAFALWEIVKIVIMVSLQPEYFTALMEPLKADPEFTDLLPITASVSVFFIILFYGIFIGLRLYIARSANEVGRRKSNKSAYIVWAIFCSFSTLLTLFINSITILTGLLGVEEVDFMGEGIVTTILDLTSLLAMLDLVISGITVKVIRKNLAREKEQG